MPTNTSSLRIVEIKEVILETPSVKTIVFEDRKSNQAKPGQFLMVWIPRKEEIPLSIMVSNKQDHAAITIRRYGYASSSLFDLRVNDLIGIRGPYGNSFTLSQYYRKIIIVGGGTGLVPLIRLLQFLPNSINEIVLIIGARTKIETFFVHIIHNILKFRNYSIIVATEDGTEGEKGYPTDVLLKLLSKRDDFDIVYTCGPELMMKKVFDITLRKGIRLEASIERYMKCGIGICSSCCINDQLVCIDGTVFNEKQLENLSEFGVSYRNKAGILENFEVNMID